jgi:hypothetical protein
MSGLSSKVHTSAVAQPAVKRIAPRNARDRHSTSVKGGAAVGAATANRPRMRTVLRLHAPSTYGTLARASDKPLPSVHDQDIKASRVILTPNPTRVLGRLVAIAE